MFCKNYFFSKDYPSPEWCFWVHNYIMYDIIINAASLVVWYFIYFAYISWILLWQIISYIINFKYDKFLYCNQGYLLRMIFLIVRHFNSQLVSLFRKLYIIVSVKLIIPKTPSISFQFINDSLGSFQNNCQQPHSNMCNPNYYYNYLWPESTS